MPTCLDAESRRRGGGPAARDGAPALCVRNRSLHGSRRRCCAAAPHLLAGAQAVKDAAAGKLCAGVGIQRNDSLSSRMRSRKPLGRNPGGFRSRFDGPVSGTFAALQRFPDAGGTTHRRRRNPLLLSEPGSLLPLQAQLLKPILCLCQ